MSNLTDTACPDCGHAKVLHPKALGYCIPCATAPLQLAPLSGPCRRVFVSIFNQDELEKLTKVDKMQFDQWALCAVCECYWMEHMGALCPSGNSVFKPLIGNA